MSENQIRLWDVASKGTDFHPTYSQLKIRKRVSKELHMAYCIAYQILTPIFLGKIAEYLAYFVKNVCKTIV